MSISGILFAFFSFPFLLRAHFCQKFEFFEYFHLFPALYMPIQLTFCVINCSLIEILYQLYIYVAGVMFAQMVCSVSRTQDVLICGVNKAVGRYPLYIIPVGVLYTTVSEKLVTLLENLNSTAIDG